MCLILRCVASAVNNIIGRVVNDHWKGISLGGLFSDSLKRINNISTCVSDARNFVNKGILQLKWCLFRKDVLEQVLIKRFLSFKIKVSCNFKVTFSNGYS